MRNSDEELAMKHGATVVNEDPIKSPDYDASKVYVWYVKSGRGVGATHADAFEAHRAGSEKWNGRRGSVRASGDTMQELLDRLS